MDEKDLIETEAVDTEPASPDLEGDMAELKGLLRQIIEKLAGLKAAPATTPAEKKKLEDI